MTPQTLVQTARTHAPKDWKGQQTVIRRLSRTKKVPEKAMHEALRSAAKLYRAQSPSYQIVRFRPNQDTPADLRAEYLRTPHAFGLGERDDILAWTRQASNATLLKMDNYRGIVTLVLFERERPEAAAFLRQLAEKKTPDEFGWLQDKLMRTPWTSKQLECIAEFTSMNTPNIWNKPHLLDAFMTQMERHGQAQVSSGWLSARLASYSLLELVDPFENMVMHKAALAESWGRLAVLITNRQFYQVVGAQQAADDWHRRSPSRQDCLDLACMFDAAIVSLEQQGYTEVESKWRERSPIVPPWVSMVGTTVQEGLVAQEMYQTLDPSLLTFSTIASAIAGNELDLIDNVSELLCP